MQKGWGGVHTMALKPSGNQKKGHTLLKVIKNPFTSFSNTLLATERRLTGC